jgi:hypothetical protein
MAPRFSLDGVKAAVDTHRQEALVLRVIEIFGSDDRILAGYLVGSFAIGQADPFSDVDLQFVIGDDAEAELQESWVSLLDEIAPPVNIGKFSGAIGGAVITADWLHYDIVFTALHNASDRVEGMLPLFDKAGVMPASEPRPDRKGEPFYPDFIVKQFIYFLGNLVSVVGRDEPVPLTNGVLMARDTLFVRLLLAEQGLETTREHTFGNPFPFTKRLRPYLTDEQNAVLEGLPPIEATIDSGIEAWSALAKAFLPRARALAEQTGAEWPTEYVRATVSYFERMLGTNLGLEV